MDIIEKLKQIERFDYLIRRKTTGTPKELSNKIQISERQVYNIINTMKNMGAPIYFCTFRQSYCYKQDVSFTFGFLTSGDKLENTLGGQGYTIDYYFSLN